MKIPLHCLMSNWNTRTTIYYVVNYIIFFAEFMPQESVQKVYTYTFAASIRTQQRQTQQRIYIYIIFISSVRKCLLMCASGETWLCRGREYKPHAREKGVVLKAPWKKFLYTHQLGNFDDPLSLSLWSITQVKLPLFLCAFLSRSSRRVVDKRAQNTYSYWTLINTIALCKPQCTPLSLLK